MAERLQKSATPEYERGGRKASGLERDVTFRDRPAAERNKQPILDVLQRVLPPRGTVLEIASGTGQHVVHFARASAGLSWQPSEADEELCEAMRERLLAAPLPNVREPRGPLDVCDDAWLSMTVDADRLHQHDSHRAVVGDGRAAAPREPVTSSRASS